MFRKIFLLIKKVNLFTSVLFIITADNLYADIFSELFGAK